MEILRKEVVEFVAERCGGEEQETTSPPQTGGSLGGAPPPPRGGTPAQHSLNTAMHPAGALLAVCGLVLGVLGKSSPGKRGSPHCLGAVNLLLTCCHQGTFQGISQWLPLWGAGFGDTGGSGGQGSAFCSPPLLVSVCAQRRPPPGPFHGDSSQGQAISESASFRPPLRSRDLSGGTFILPARPPLGEGEGSRQETRPREGR